MLRDRSNFMTVKYVSRIPKRNSNIIFKHTISHYYTVRLPLESN